MALPPSFLLALSMLVVMMVAFVATIAGGGTPLTTSSENDGNKKMTSAMMTAGPASSTISTETMMPTKMNSTSTTFGDGLLIECMVGFAAFDREFYEVKSCRMNCLSLTANQFTFLGCGNCSSFEMPPNENYMIGHDGGTWSMMKCEECAKDMCNQPSTTPPATGRASGIFFSVFAAALAVLLLAAAELVIMPPGNGGSFHMF